MPRSPYSPAHCVLEVTQQLNQVNADYEIALQDSDTGLFAVVLVRTNRKAERALFEGSSELTKIKAALDEARNVVKSRASRAIDLELIIEWFSQVIMKLGSSSQRPKRNKTP